MSAAYRKAKGSGRKVRKAAEADVLPPVPRVDANYLRTVAGAVCACVVECLRPVLEAEMLRAARSGAFDCSLNVTALCGRFETEVDDRWAAAGLVDYARSVGVQAAVERGESRRLGMVEPCVVLLLSWRGGMR